MSQNTIGVDVGGTKIFAARYNQDLTVLAHKKVKTKADQGQVVVLQQLENTVAQLIDKDTTAIGLAWAGFINPETGVIIKSPNIKSLSGFNIVGYLEEIFKIPVILENDARAFTIGEYRARTQKPKVLLGLIFGTGVGSGLVIDGKIFHGAHATAGEVGHMRQAGIEIEAKLAGPALNKQLGPKTLSNMKNTVPKPIIKRRLLNQYTNFLRDLILVYDPDLIVVGGGAGVHFWKYLKKDVIKLLNKKVDHLPTSVNLDFSQLENAGALGAAYLAQHEKK